MAEALRRGRAQDVGAILDLLTEYDLPRSDFEAFYLSDPTYRPDQSWLIEADQSLAAHVRIFDRTLYMGEGELKMAGIGNVITSRSQRGKGYAQRLLSEISDYLSTSDYSCSVLWTHIPELYERYGWTPVPQTAVVADIVWDGEEDVLVRELRDADLEQARSLYHEVNRLRTGPTVRDTSYWRWLLSLTASTGGRCLGAWSSGGQFRGYVMFRETEDGADLLDLATVDNDRGTARCLLAGVGSGSRVRLKGAMPVSMTNIFPEGEVETVDRSGLMVKILDPAAVPGIQVFTDPEFVIWDADAF